MTATTQKESNPMPQMSLVQADRLAEHHRKWSSLPEFPQWPYVMTDDDVQAWSDILYMRGLTDAIEDLADLAESPMPDLDGRMSEMLGLAAELGHLELADHAAELLDAWRAAA